MSANTTDRGMGDVVAVADDQARKATLAALDVFEELGERIQWGHGYFTAVHCICFDAEIPVGGHAATRGKTPDRISEVRRLMQPFLAAGDVGTD